MRQETFRPETQAPGSSEVIKRQIRGSTLLLMGRLLAMAVNFAVQVMIVRYLSKTSYGAFTYALSVVSLCQIIATFSLDKAITRFLPIYQEERDHKKIFGAIVIVVGTIVSISVILIATVFLLQGFIGDSLTSEPEAVSLLLILVFLAPLQALDTLTLGLLAVFSRPRAIFFRAYVLAPGLRLLVVLLLIGLGSDVLFLAGGYVAAGALGVAIYTGVLFRALKNEGVIKRFAFREIELPIREIFALTLPLLTTNLLYVLLNSSGILMLGYFQGVAEVAEYTVVRPAAELNELVLASFTLLYTTSAARLFARNDREAITDLYWQTAGWVALMSFPVFVLTFALAKPLTVTLYGARYEESATLLALLALGSYFQAALGMNGTTVMVFGKVRYIMAVSALTMVFNVGANLLLIPPYGALGAALGTTTTMVVHNILKQISLRLATGITLFPRRYLNVYLTIIGATLVVTLIQRKAASDIYSGVVLAALASLVVFRLNRRLLRMSHMFPELLQIPLARRLLTSRKRA